MLIIYIYIKYIHACILFLYKTANPGLFTRIIIQPPYTYIYIQLSFVLSHFQTPCKSEKEGEDRTLVVLTFSKRKKKNTKQSSEVSLFLSFSLFALASCLSVGKKEKERDAVVTRL